MVRTMSLIFSFLSSAETCELRQVQQLRGAGKAAVFHHVDERFELFDIHINVHEVPPSDRQKQNVLR